MWQISPKFRKHCPIIPKIDPSITYPFEYLQKYPVSFKFLANIPKTTSRDSHFLGSDSVVVGSLLLLTFCACVYVGRGPENSPEVVINSLPNGVIC